MKAGFTMKALSLAVLGLAGLGFGANAFAACPSITPATPTPWTSASVTSTYGSLAISGGSPGQGLNGTSCKMDVSIAAGSPANVKALVSDDTPANEARYRARFYVDLTGYTNFNNAGYQHVVFNAFADTAPAGTSTDEVAISLVGSGSNPAVRFLVADAAQPSKFRTITVPLPNPAGVNRIEFDVSQGASGSFKCWVSAGNVATSEGSPTPAACAAITVNNSGWSGITFANLGLFSTTSGFRANMAGKILSVDEFDSRRSTFIGQ